MHSLDDRYIYMYGGFNDNEQQMFGYEKVNPDWARTKPLFEELWRFCKLTKRWELLPTKGTSPAFPASACMVMIDYKTLLVYGGSGYPFAQQNSNLTYLCDLETLTWEEMRYAPSDDWKKNPPLERYGQAVLYDNDHLYVCGGTDGYQYSLELYRLNVKTCEWQMLSMDPSEVVFKPRYRHELALWDNKLYVICGGTAGRSCSNEMVKSLFQVVASI